MEELRPEICHGLDRINPTELGTNRPDPFRLDRLLVHTRGPEISDFLLERAVWGARLGRIFHENLMQRVAVTFGHLFEPAEPGVLRGKGIRLAPFADGVLVE